MSDFSLVPVDHEPDFTDVSFIPVDHDPFAADDVTQQVAVKPESQPQPLATGSDLPDVGPPAIGNGGQVSAGYPFANKAADIASKVAYGMMGQVVTLPQRAMDASRESFAHTYGPGPSTTSDSDVWVDPLAPIAAETATMMSGRVGAPRAGTVLADARPLRGSSNPLASRSASIYNPPIKSPRPFEADYPSGASSDVAGRLTKDIDGRDLTAGVVVGRRTLGGADEALTPAQLDAAAKATLGESPSQVPASALPRNTVGAYGDARGPDGPERWIHILKDLEPAARAKVTFHEFGHALDDLAGTIRTKGLSRELRDVYNSLNNPTRNAAGTDAVAFNGTGRTRPWSPKESGYKGDDVEREYVAEALRAYMTDPNYLKTVAPKTAATIRKFVNDNPRLNRFIQFNSIVIPVGIGAANGDSGDAQ